MTRSLVIKLPSFLNLSHSLKAIRHNWQWQTYVIAAKICTFVSTNTSYALNFTIQKQGSKLTSSENKLADFLCAFLLRYTCIYKKYSNIMWQKQLSHFPIPLKNITAVLRLFLYIVFRRRWFPVHHNNRFIFSVFLFVCWRRSNAEV